MIKEKTIKRKCLVEGILDVAIPITMVLIIALCVYGMLFVDDVCSFIIGIPVIIVTLFVFVNIYILGREKCPY